MAKRSSSAKVHEPEAGTVATGVTPLRRTPILLARHFLQICRAAADETLAGEGLKSGQFAVLVSLSRVTGEPDIDQNGLATRLGFDRARVSQLVDELEAAGLIDRRVNGADRRARLLRLTPRGEQLRTQLQPVHNTNQMRVLASLLPEERELLIDLLLRVIRSNLSKQRSRQSTTGKRRPSPPSRT